jgi:Bacterial PH domain
MIRFNCDNCEMEIELDDEFAGTKHECLGCGDINRVPTADSEPRVDEPAPDSKKKDRAAEAGFPPDFGPEIRVQLVRRCWFRSRAIRFSLVVLAIIVGLIGVIWVPVQDKSWVWLILFVPMVLGGLGLLVWWWVDRLGASIEITTKRTIMHRGIFSKSSSEVVHDNIRNIQVNQTFLQRMTQVGKIGISSSGQDGIELQVNHLRDPDNLRKIIDLYRPL